MQVEAFMQSLETQTKSTETLRAYRQDIVRFDNFLKGKSLAPSQVGKSTMTEYIIHLEATRGRTSSTSLAPATIARRLAVVSEYYRWLQQASDETLVNPVERVRRPKVRNVFSRAVDNDTLALMSSGITDLRGRALLLLFVFSGLRLSELRSLDRTTITIKREELPDGTQRFLGAGRVTGKGGRVRDFLVGIEAVQAVIAYLTESRASDNNPALFISSRGGRLSCRSIQHIMSQSCLRLNIPHINIHRLRHSYATRNVNAGMSAAVLQTLMGHASLVTTQRYFSIETERISREYYSVMEFVRLSAPL